MLDDRGENTMKDLEHEKNNLWDCRADQAQESLYTNFWNNDIGVMNQALPESNPNNDHPIYWWHAHVIDVLVDGYNRTKDTKYLYRLEDMFDGVKRFNGDTLHHNFYDDMEWMALALLRAWDLTGVEKFKVDVLDLWEDIKTAWNTNMGGGMAWKKDQLDYKNTPANAPASILACRLYQRFHDEENLEWAKRIYEWNKTNLVDPESGFVWDGLNREGHGNIDKDWEFTYCQGVFIGAAIELYRYSNDYSYIESAKKTALAAIDKLTDSSTGMLKDEGNGDCGLFKGIFVRYINELIKVCPDFTPIVNLIEINARTLWENGRDSKNGIFSQSWSTRPEEMIDLSTHLSGIMLVEMMASYKNK